MRRLSALGLSVMLLFALVPTASADARCGGRPGIQFWADINKGNPSVILCGGLLPAWATIRDNDFNNSTGSMPGGWNDRVSSLQTFNTPAGQGFAVYAQSGYKGRRIKITGNDYIADMRKFWPLECPDGLNDRVSSFISFDANIPPASGTGC